MPQGYVKMNIELDDVPLQLGIRISYEENNEIVSPESLDVCVHTGPYKPIDNNLLKRYPGMVDSITFVVRTFLFLAGKYYVSHDKRFDGDWNSLLEYRLKN